MANRSQTTSILLWVIKWPTCKVAIASKLRGAYGFSAMDLTSLTIWKPNEELLIGGVQRNKVWAVWEGKIKTANNHLDAITTELDPDEVVSSTSQPTTGKPLVHIIVQVAQRVPHRESLKRHIEEEDSGSHKRQERREGDN